MSTAGAGGGFFSGGLYTSGGGTAFVFHALNSLGGCGREQRSGQSHVPDLRSRRAIRAGAGQAEAGQSAAAPPPSPPGPYLLGRPQDAALPVDLLVERVVEEGGRLGHLPEELVRRRQLRPPPRTAPRRRAGSRLPLLGRGLVGLRVRAGAAVGREVAQRVLSLRRHGGAAQFAARTETGPAPRVPPAGPGLLCGRQTAFGRRGWK